MRFCKQPGIGCSDANRVWAGKMTPFADLLDENKVQSGVEYGCPLR